MVCYLLLESGNLLQHGLYFSTYFSTHRVLYDLLERHHGRASRHHLSKNGVCNLSSVVGNRHIYITHVLSF